MLKFPSIESFRHVVATVKRQCDYKRIPYPKIAYKGAVKLHGTNAGININFAEGILTPQSRERVLTLESDNAGFAAWVKQNEEKLWNLFGEICNDDGPVTVFGEWIGPGIQKNVAINQLPNKMFVVFAIAHDDEIEVTDDGQQLATFYTVRNWRNLEVPEGVAFVADIERPTIEIDFNQPDLIVPELERLTNEYENQCPFAKKYGIEGTGEGLVWYPDVDLLRFDLLPHNMLYRLWFKTKGEKHGNKGTNNKVKVAVTAEKVEDFNALLAQIMPEWRLEQGMAKLREAGSDPTRENTGEFIKWVVGDVHKEELDTVEASEFEWKVVAGELSKRARNWFLSRT